MKKIFLLLIIIYSAISCFSQETNNDMTNIHYTHNIAPSKQSKMIKKIMGMIQINKNKEKRISKNTHSKSPAKVPKSIQKNYNIICNLQAERQVWEIKPKNDISDIVIIYFHGGAYYANIFKQHWQFIEQIAKLTKSHIVVPDYPLTPESVCLETFDFVEELYKRIIRENPNKRIVLMGDSAGAGLALGFAQYIRAFDIVQAQHIVLLSPWLDVSMTNPEIEKYEKFEKILCRKSLIISGERYAGELSVNDYRISPIYGNFDGLGTISIFIGTHDILYPDAFKLKDILLKAKHKYNFFEYPEMFHDWLIITSLDESKHAINEISKIVIGDN